MIFPKPKICDECRTNPHATQRYCAQQQHYVLEAIALMGVIRYQRRIYRERGTLTNGWLAQLYEKQFKHAIREARKLDGLVGEMSEE